MSTAESKVIEYLFRPARHSDIGYFVDVAREFNKSMPYTLDEDSYTISIHELIKDPDAIFVVKGNPAIAHCLIRLGHSIYNQYEIIARVVSTWGPGGLECFRYAEALAQAEGAHFLIADSFAETRIEKFYLRNGMKEMDKSFCKEF